MTDADELERMLRSADEPVTRSRDPALRLSVGPVSFVFDAREQLAEVETQDDDEESTTVDGSLRSVIDSVSRLRNSAAPDQWPQYDRALRALEGLT